MTEERREDIPCDSAEDAAISEAVTNRQNLERNITNLQNVWGYSSVGVEAKRAAMTMLSTKTGMYARIPLRCKADDCPYKDTCSLLPYNLAPFGELCPLETTQIELRYTGYERDFNLDDSSFTDKVLVSELINLDIMISRCQALIAQEEVPIEESVSHVDEQGNVYYKKEVSKAVEAHDRFVRRRNEIYQLMMGTRKDKKGDQTGPKSITEILAEAQVNGFVIDQKPQHIVDAEIK